MKELGLAGPCTSIPATSIPFIADLYLSLAHYFTGTDRSPIHRERKTPGKGTSSAITHIRDSQKQGDLTDRDIPMELTQRYRQIELDTSTIKLQTVSTKHQETHTPTPRTTRGDTTLTTTLTGARPYYSSVSTEPAHYLQPMTQDSLRPISPLELPSPDRSEKAI